jgi:ABC-type xylose transport system permease subunit
MTTNYTEEQVLDYARRRIKFMDEQKGKRSAMAFSGIMLIALLIWFVRMISEKSDRIGTNLFADEKFIYGVAAGVVFIILGIAASLSVVSMISPLYAREIETYRLLIKLKDGNGQKPT